MLYVYICLRVYDQMSSKIFQLFTSVRFILQGRTPFFASLTSFHFSFWDKATTKKNEVVRSSVRMNFFPCLSVSYFGFSFLYHFLNCFAGARIYISIDGFSDNFHDIFLISSLIYFRRHLEETRHTAKKKKWRNKKIAKRIYKISDSRTLIVIWVAYKFTRLESFRLKCTLA